MIARAAFLHAFASAARRARPSSALRALLAAGALALGAAASAQEIAAGTLLVASPELGDPNFSRSVVLVLRHDDSGAIGVVINRLTSLTPAKVFPELAAGLGSYSGTLYRLVPFGSGWAPAPDVWVPPLSSFCRLSYGLLSSASTLDFTA